MPKWIWRCEFVDMRGETVSSLIAENSKEGIEDVLSEFYMFMRGCGYTLSEAHYGPESVDHGEEAVSYVLAERIEDARNYIRASWDQPPIDLHDHRATLSNLMYLLEGRDETPMDELVNEGQRRGDYD